MADAKETAADAQSHGSHDDDAAADSMLVDIALPAEPGDGAMARPAANNARPSWNYQYVAVNPSEGIPPAYRFAFRERDIRLCICVTGYNEDYDQLNNTLAAINENLDRAEHFTGGTLKPHQVLVFVVFDGRHKVNPSIFKDGEKNDNTYFTWERDWKGMARREAEEDARREARARAAEHAETKVAGNTGIAVVPVSTASSEAHIYETTLRLNKNKTVAFETEMQLMFCYKVKNGGKIDSHRWFFYALCKRIQPDYCCIVDMGTNPGPTAILRLVVDMDQNQQIGGCCGQIAIDTSAGHCVYADPIVASQIYEYKASNFLDKAMESCFGYISVLPGAFSAYRYDAIREFPDDPHAPLHEYFKLADMNEAALGRVDPLTANMYLAEDRILGFEMLVRRGYDWTLHYNADAPAYTDCPSNLAAIISQRRRWLNGSFFAQLHVIRGSFTKLWANNHSLTRKLCLALLMFYNFCQVLLTVTLLGNSYLIFLITLQLVIPEDNDRWQVVRFTMSCLFLLVTAAQFIFALGNSPRDPANRARLNKVYTTCSIIYGCLMLFATISVFFKVDEFSKPVFWTGVFTFCALYVGALVHGEFLPVAATSVQFVSMLLTFLMIFPIYSFCNVHDISWGTRETNPEAAKFKAQREEVFKLFRSLFVLGWVFINLVMVSVVLEFEITDSYAKFLVVIVVVFLGARLTGSLLYVALKYGKRVRPTLCRRRSAPAGNGYRAPRPAAGVAPPTSAGHDAAAPASQPKHAPAASAANDDGDAVAV